MKQGGEPLLPMTFRSLSHRLLIEAQLDPKTMQVLRCLAESGGALVTRLDLMRQVWNRNANRDVLDQAIRKIRDVLGERSIETISKTGVRLKVKVTSIKPLDSGVVSKTPSLLSRDPAHHHSETLTNAKTLCITGLSMTRFVPYNEACLQRLLQREGSLKVMMHEHAASRTPRHIYKSGGNGELHPRG